MAPRQVPDREVRSNRRHHVVVIGAGFGGLAVARSLGDAPVDVTLIEANNFHTFQPLLYQVATAGLDSPNVAYAVRGIFRRQHNVEVRMARVTDIDLDANAITLDSGATVPYDTLVIAAGAVSTSFGVPGVDEHGLPLKSLDDAIAIRRRILDQFERAAADPSLVDDGALNVVVCGGGPTGVEMAGGIMELFNKVLQHDFPDLPVRWARVVLVEAADRLLPPFSEQSSRRALRTLTRRRVEVHVGVGVERVEPTRVHLADGTVVPAHTVIWAAGVAASPLAKLVGTETTRRSTRRRRRPVDPGTSRGVRDRRHRRDVDAAPPGGTARHPGRSPRGGADPPTVEWSGDRAVPLRRQGFDGDDRPTGHGRRSPGRDPPHWSDRLGGVAGAAPPLSHGLPQPHQRVRELVLELPDLRPWQPPARRIAAHRSGGSRPPAGVGGRTTFRGDLSRRMKSYKLEHVRTSDVRRAR
ncbi:MAG: FAD-dependent oxidoreductase [Microthrixaceae bacterium]